jgi:ABC-type glycerol-3-phosphate transport system substrate-binding protein
MRKRYPLCNRTHIVLTALLACSMLLATSVSATKLTVVIPTDPVLDPWFVDLAELFEAEHPGVDVELIFSGGDRMSYPDRINVLLAGGMLPDIAFMHERDAILGGWLLPGALVDLKPYIARDKALSNDSLFKTSAAAWTYDGRILGLPLGLGLQPLFYEISYFEKAGIASPATQFDAGGWYFDDLLAAAKRLTIDADGDGKPEQWGYTANWNIDKIWGSYLYSNNAEFFDPQLTRSLIHEQKSVEAIEFLTDLYTKHRVATTGNMANVNTAMSTAGINIGPRAASLGKRVGAGIAARGVGANSVSITLTHVFSIYESCAHKELAWQFIRRALETDILVKWMNLSMQLPTVQSGVQPWMREAQALFDRPDLLITAIGTSRGMPFFPGWWDIQTEITKTITDIINNRLAVRVAFEELSQRINAMLKK